LNALSRWRNGVSFSVSAQRGGKMSEDIAVPIDQLASTITCVGDIAQRFGLEGCSWGHAGDGNAHATLMIDAVSVDQVAAASQAMQELFEFVLSIGGSVSGEHGIGWVKRDQFDRQFGQVVGGLQRVIKRTMDPANLFNPGKKLPFAIDPDGSTKAAEQRVRL
jgi:FAD/FMN-containing dehydrogenase